MATEKRLIDGNKAQAVLVNMAEHLMEAGNPELAGAVGYAAELIGKQKTVDAVEVVHGHNTYDHNSAFGCSVCGFEDWDTNTADIHKYNYCPNCGAKMDGDGNGT